MHGGVLPSCGSWLQPVACECRKQMAETLWMRAREAGAWTELERRSYGELRAQTWRLCCGVPRW